MSLIFIPNDMPDDRLDFFGSGLCTFCHNAINEFERIRRAYNKIDKLWQDENELIDVRMERSIEELDDEEQRYSVGESYSLDYHEIYSYEVLYRHSSLITIQNALEHSLDELCKVVAFTMASNIKHSDLKDSGFKRSFKFLSKVAGFDLSSISPERGFISDAQLIRNCIVHAGAVLTENSSDRLLGLVRDSSLIRGSLGQSIIIEHEFIEEYFNKLACLFKKLNTEVVRFMNRQLSGTDLSTR